MLLEGLVGERDVGAAQRHGSGDAVAFGQLYETYYPRLLRYCRRRVRDSFTAEELAQDAFMRAYAAYARLDSADRFYPWLTVIAKRLIIDHYRRSGRSVASADLDPGTVDGAESAIMRRVEYEEVWQALDRVRLRHQEVLRLRDLEGLSYDAIAERLGAPATTVPPLLHRARKALRREYFALTESERLLALPPTLFTVVLGLRRIRTKISHSLAMFGDASSLAAPAAAVAVLAVSGIGGAYLAPTPGGAQDSDRAPLASTFAPLDDRMSLGGPSRQPYQDTNGTVGGTSPDMVVGVAGVSWDDEHTRRGRARDEHMPVFVEVGEGWVAADPDTMRHDMESTLAGDTEWMEERCGVSGQQCSSPAG